MTAPRVDDTRAAQHYFEGRTRRWARALLVAAVVAVLNLLVWRAFNPPLPAYDVPARVAGLAYNPFQRHDSPLSGRLPDTAQIDADLRQLASLTGRLRTYSASELPQLPALADKHGMRLTLGVWLDQRADNNRREITAAIDAAHRHRSVERVIAGNETQLHGSLTPAELAAVLAELRRTLEVPVSTAEPWHIWLAHPELAAQVDFITVHLLPYWEGVPEPAALDEALRRYRQVRERFPDKAVVIGEIGWPSGGPTIQAPRWSPELGIAAPAEADPAAQARFVRRLLHTVQHERLDYYLMEATDQPWKRATEGRVGAHWGLLDAARRPKFDFAGPVQADPFWGVKAALSAVLGLAALPALLVAFDTIGWRGRWVLAVCVQAIASFAAALGLLPLVDYLRPLDLAMMLLLVPALALLGVILLTQVVEFTEMHWPQGLRRRAAPRPLAPHAPAPYVSLHLACCDELPEQVIATIDSLVALDWPDFEVLVIDNNTADATRWQPVQAHVEALRSAAAGSGSAVRARFVHLPHWPGYKAGALNYALAHTDVRADWVGVVDADYVVQRDWLRQLGGWFDTPGVAVVQSPQAHRSWSRTALGRMMNWEYDGFFRIGMHHRHERNAIVQHGTMTLVRAASLRESGGWAEDCVCEDAELGLRLLARGEQVVYVDRVFGSGLVPTDFAAYARQRQRWAEGGMQILRLHARALFAPGRTRLSLAQRYHFVAGWLPWVGDAAHLLFTFAAMAWTAGVLMAPQHVGPPIGLFVLPLAVFFFARLVMTPLLYRRLVPCGAADRVGAAWAGMALSHAVARGVFAGLGRRRAVFHVTRKGANAPLVSWHGTLRAVREETFLLVGLVVCMVGVALAGSPWPDGRAGWLLVLLLQGVPYVAALACAWLSASGSEQTARALATGPRVDFPGS